LCQLAISVQLFSDIQFWLDVGSRSWAERLYQPLTIPMCQSRWQADSLTDLDDGDW
jgi:hypothetical protein